MFKVDDIVRHTTGITAKVIGYGERISARYYSTTFIIELRSDTAIVPIAEDVVEKWMCRDKRILACTLPHFPKRNEPTELTSI